MKNHDKIATRLSTILTKLNNGERLSVEVLAKEFNVTTRTIQRDLNERFSEIPLQKENKHYFLDTHYLGHLNFSDIKNLALFSGIKKMFPAFDKEFLRQVLDKSTVQPFLIKSHNYEDINRKLELFQRITEAIQDHRVLKLLYRNKQRKVHPYKLANVKGVWYLIALQDEVIKTFTFSKILNLKVLDDSFVVQRSILKKIEDEDTLWFSNDKTEVVLKVNSVITDHFKRRNIIAYQKILEEYNNGDLLISTQMTYDEEVLQLVRYWIPNITIVSPQYLHEKLEASLLDYLH